MNVNLLLQVREEILMYPHTYNQSDFCGTAHCIGGHAVAIADPRFWNEWRNNNDGPQKITARAEELIKHPSYGGLCGFACDWPEEWADRYDDATCNKERAQVAADVIIDFIVTDGWMKPADPTLNPLEKGHETEGHQLLGTTEQASPRTAPTAV